MRTFALLATLTALLVASTAYAVFVWTESEGPPMPPFIWAALAGGVFFSFLVGSGLMALLFYSARHGYDEAASEATRDKQQHRS